MMQTYTEIGDLAFFLLNGSLSVLTIMANLFFIFCLFCPIQGREGLKQPVKILLESLVCSTNIYLVSLITGKGVCQFLSCKYPGLSYATDCMAKTTLSTSISSSIWLNVFYYTQIVPAQQPVLIWLKKNIKIIIFYSLFAHMVLSLFDDVIYLLVVTKPKIVSGINSTFNSTFTSTNGTFSGLNCVLEMQAACQFLKKCLCLIFLCMMVGSSWATVRYLHGHMKIMKESDSSFSSPRLTSQIRVTITGILQGIYSFFCLMWIVTDFFRGQISSYTAQSFDKNGNICYTVISLYMFGTSVNLGIGQSIFRRRAGSIWFKCQEVVRSLSL